MELYCRSVSIFDEQFMDEFSMEHLNLGEKILGGDASLISGKSYHEYDDFYAWYKDISKLDIEDKLKTDQVCCSVYLVFDKVDDKLVGIFDIRHSLDFPNGDLLGHIGVDIRPSERGKGLYKQILELCTEECKKNSIFSIVISCEYDNIASKRGIEHLFELKREMVPFNGTYLFVYKMDV